MHARIISKQKPDKSPVPNAHGSSFVASVAKRVYVVQLDLGTETEGVLARVGDVQEAILILEQSQSVKFQVHIASLRGMYLVLFVDAAHECGSRRQHLINEDEDGLLWGELDALADNIYELADGEVGWH